MTIGTSTVKSGEIYTPEIKSIGKVKSFANFYEQLAVPLIDESESMFWPGINRLTKYQNVQLAAKEFLDRMLRSKNAKSFYLACINYSSRATVTLGTTSIQSIDIDQILEPSANSREGTLLEPGLIEAKTLIDEFLNQPNPSGIYRSAVVMVLSDGMLGDSTFPTLEVLRTTPHVSITSTFFGDVEMSDTERERCESVLRDVVATSPNHFMPTASAEELRRFYEASVSVNNQSFLVE